MYAPIPYTAQPKQSRWGIASFVFSLLTNFSLWIGNCTTTGRIAPKLNSRYSSRLGCYRCLFREYDCYCIWHHWDYREKYKEGFRDTRHISQSVGFLFSMCANMLAHHAHDVHGRRIPINTCSRGALA